MHNETVTGNTDRFILFLENYSKYHQYLKQIANTVFAIYVKLYQVSYG
jgi:hypothetical protein